MTRLERVIKGRGTVSLFLLPLLLAGVAAGRYLLLGGSVQCDDGGVIAMAMADHGNDFPAFFVGGLALLMLVSYLLFFIADRYKILSRATVLPAVAYALLSVGIYCRHGASSYVVAAAVVALAVARLHHAILRVKGNAAIFDFGLLTALAVLLCPKLALLAAWAVVVLPLSGRGTLKDMSAFFLGFVVTGGLVFAYFFLTDRAGEFPARFADAMLAGEWLDYRLSPARWCAAGMLLLLTIVALARVLGYSSSAVVARRRGLMAMVLLAIFLGSGLFLVPLECPGFFLVLFVPISFLYAQYFISFQGRWLGNTLFLLFLASCLLAIL
ncbi:MAG: hypothetical protein LBI96_00305 [Odoribacteraceae bacterium]|jgi:hypothetical protein|nr:hypothetical protein [Odoribacteraceae bacterium]